MNKTLFLTFLILFIISILVFTKENTQKVKNIILKENSVILAFGDSLTYGFGASSEFSYPKLLEKRTGFKVINAGINGKVSSEGLHRLPILLKHNPDLVILCHGGNDIIQKLSSKQLKENLLAMIQLIEQSGAKVLFVGVPDFSLFGFDTHELYEEIADETDVVFESEVLTYIQNEPSLKSDYVHPNAKGYEKMADSFIEVLKTNDFVNAN